MSGYPDGVTQASFDRHFADLDEPEDSRCPRCGATEDQACKEWCGLENQE